MNDYIFKTIYFPKEKVKSGKSARVNISIPPKNKLKNDREFLIYITSINSREFRNLLGNPFLEDLENEAIAQNRSFSNLCVSIAKNNFENINVASSTLSIINKKNNDEGIGLTFKDSLRQGVFGWYPYVEGFSATYTRDAILRYGKPKTVYDPFGGSGTTQLACSMLGIDSFFSELNPFMSFVAKTKVISSRKCKENFKKYKTLVTKYLKGLQSDKLIQMAKEISLDDYSEAFPKRDFFEIKDLRLLLAAIKLGDNIAGDVLYAKNIFRLACASNAVACSNMTRRADLRRRRTNEYKNRVVNVASMISDSLHRMTEDIKSLPENMVTTTEVSNDAKKIPQEYKNAFEFAITSPPYLNGTNYFRNTKLELWLMGFIKSEKELSDYRKTAITAGINNVSKNEKFYQFDEVEKVAQQLDKTSKDKRIPTMVRHYFSDMFVVFQQVHNSLVDGGKFLMDIGDSKFYGIHVPTDKLLIYIGKEAGFEILNEHILARRMSRDKTPLVQVELVFRKNKKPIKKNFTISTNSNSRADLINKFQLELPFKDLPYSKKSWGHSLHSLCSYQGKLKPALAYWLINYFVPKNGSILDPLGGVGTIPFEGALNGRSVVSNDKSPFASVIAKGKIRPSNKEEVLLTLFQMEQEASSIKLLKDDFKSSEFGLNSSVKDYYHPETLKEILKLRKLFLKTTFDEKSDEEIFIWACLLHILHGNRPYALSRSSHSITPFSPKGPTVYKNVKEKILEKIERAYKDDLPNSFVKGKVFNSDFRELNRHIDEKFDAIICSPPFYGMRFDRPNWLRLWFCGWIESDFKNQSQSFLERQQIKDINVYTEFFEKCHLMLKDSGIMILHLASGGKRDMTIELQNISSDKFRFIGVVNENVQSVAKHGIIDKGLTKSQSLLFFEPKSI
ncbi:class I SAM-dependent methyltransferase [Tenacibaculum ascidiaceicola]|uniref:DNA methyltransferase n=1 Tax=Tenacibaculum ascidiaceicola TaxID=1699411 RepID=UPI0039E8864B